jgi:hypothetical protein
MTRNEGFATLARDSGWSGFDRPNCRKQRSRESRFSREQFEEIATVSAGRQSHFILSLNGVQGVF